MLDVFSIGMRSTQLSESLNNALKMHLKSDLDIVRFLKRVEHVVEDKRERELQASCTEQTQASLFSQKKNQMAISF